MGHTLSGRYILERRLAIGGMAEIFLARVAGVEGFEKRVVIKRMLPTHAERQDFVQMFLDEARLAGLFNHPNLIQVYELARLDGQYCLAMEYLEGEDLDEVLNACERRERLPDVETAAHVIAEVADALFYAHTLETEDGQPLNVVHRDISPANIIVTYHGGVKLVDFGIAKHEAASTQTQTGIIKGKYSYMSPEQIIGSHLDQRSDIFALGAVLYETLTLARCFTKSTPMETFQAIARGDYRPVTEVRPDVPIELSNMLDRMLANRREDRYPDADAVSRDLRGFLQQRRPVTAGDVRRLMRELFEETGLHNTVAYSGIGAKPVKVGGELASANVTVSAEAYRRILEESQEDEPVTRPITAFSADAVDPGDETVVQINTDDILEEARAAAQTSDPREEPTVRIESLPGGDGGGDPRPWASASTTDVEAYEDTDPDAARDERTAIVRDDTARNPSLALGAGEPRRRRGWLWGTGITLGIVLGALALVASESTRPTPSATAVTETEPPVPLEAIGQPPTAAPVATIRVSSQPAGAAILLDGRNTGQSTPGNIAVPGGVTHELSALLDGYESIPIRVSPEPGEATSAVLQLRAVRRGAGSGPRTKKRPPREERPPPETRSASTSRTALVIVTSDPPATLMLDGKRVGQTPAELTVTPGSHNLRAYDKGLGFSKTLPLRVKAGQTLRKNLLFGKGTVVVNSVPWADVYLGDQKLGTTPLVTELYEGTHNLRLTNPEQNKTRQVRVIVRSGQKTKVSESL